MMDLVRWNPWKEMATLKDRMSRIWGENFFGTDLADPIAAAGGWYPAVDMFEKDDKVVIKAELPGLDKRDIRLDVKNGMLTLKGERRRENEVKEENFYRREMSFGRFMRSFALPAGVDPDQIQAEFQNGILTVEIPKPEDLKPKQIKVN